MLWAFEVLSSLAFGYSLVTMLIGDVLDPVQRVLAGSPLGFFSFAWICFIFSYKKRLTKITALPALAIQIAAIVYFNRHTEKKKKRNMTVKFNIFQLISLAIFCIFFTCLMYFSLLYKENESKGAGYGDLPFHMNIISSFANGCNLRRKSFFKVETVFYAGKYLAYPYMTNYFTACLMATGGATMRAAAMFPSIIISCSLVFGIYYLGILFHKDHFASLIALFAFCTLGGLGFIHLFQEDCGDRDLIHKWTDKIYENWFHSIMHVIVPQRASLWSMPICYWCLICLIIGIEQEKWQYFLLAALYVGVVPLIQVHSYVALAQWAIVFAAINFPWTNKEKAIKHIKLWAIFGIVANVLAVPQFTPFLERLKSKNEDNERSFIVFKPMWKQPEREQNFITPFRMWWRSLGVFAVISLVSGWLVLNKRQCIIYIPSIFVFLLTNFIWYQPWVLDNTKIFYAAWIPFALQVYAMFMAKLLRSKLMFLPAIVLLAASSCASIRYTYRSLVKQSVIYEDDAKGFSKWANENFPLDAIFLTTSWHCNPIMALCGRKTFMGYGGWVTTHGLDYVNRYTMQMRMSNDPNYMDLFNNFNISYVVAHKDEFPMFVSIKSNRNWIKIYDYDRFQVWKRVY